MEEQPAGNARLVKQLTRKINPWGHPGETEVGQGKYNR